MADDPNGGKNSDIPLIPPSVVERAAELGIPRSELEALQGTGPSGRLRPSDIAHLRAATGATIRNAASSVVRPVAPAAAGAVNGPALGTTAGAMRVRLDDERRERARRAMVDATSAADLTSAVEVDFSRFVGVLEARTAGSPGSTDFSDELLAYVARSVIAALRVHPILNARIDMETEGGRMLLRESVDLALVVSENSGDVRTVIPAAETLSDESLRGQVRAAGLLARAGIVGAPDDLGDGTVPAPATFTIIDRRGRPLLFETPPLSQGSSGALAVGRLEKRPLVDARTGGLRVAWAAYLSLTYDHRLVDGADAARFLGDLRSTLEGS